MRFTFFLLFILLPTISIADVPFRICYFSLNDHRDFEHTAKFMKKLSQSGSQEIEVKEFLNDGEDATKSFEKMVASGIRCDGLVIAGHNTGAWGGKRSAGKLDINTIEKLSCNPKYVNWFNSINAAWLEGCRTLGVGIITPDQEQKQDFDADYHTNRVGQELTVDGLASTFSELNYEFSNTLDQDNPMDSRYSRIFPSAKTFGWTKSAPGLNAHSELSMLYHMAHTAKLLDENGDYPENPESEDLSPAQLSKYMDAVALTLSELTVEQKSCEDLTVDAWLDHGKAPVSTQFAFENPDLKAKSSLKLNPEETLNKAHAINCLLKQAATEGDEQKIINAMAKISDDPAMLRYSFQPIVSLYYALLRTNKREMAGRLLEMMRSNPELDYFLREKMQKNQLGTLRKIDYYRFYSNLNGQRDPELEKDIHDKSRKILLEPLPVEPPINRTNSANYRATIFQSVMKNKIGTIEFYYSLLVPSIEPDIQNSMLANIDFLALPPDEKKQMIISILRSPRVDTEVWLNAKKILVEMGTPKKEIKKIEKEVNDRINQGYDPNAPVILVPPSQEGGDPPPNRRRRGLLPWLFGG